ncbi:uncharacterized protein [Rutidosis leptorrhynchoides]|uniref:uncharacterized protein n=1 Tax=Rutidosis leptorrhynchoides TaxID=125765 RepID=UPI003A9A35A5
MRSISTSYRDNIDHGGENDDMLEGVPNEEMAVHLIIIKDAALELQDVGKILDEQEQRIKLNNHQLRSVTRNLDEQDQELKTSNLRLKSACNKLHDLLKRT